MRIPSVDKLKKMITNARGNVFLELTGNDFFDLKMDNTSFKILMEEANKNHKIKIHVFDTKDYLDFVNYIVGSAYD
jgi:hypothetical protein